MTQVTVQRTLDVSQARIWPVLADFSNIYRFHPAVARSSQIGELATGLGAERRCDFYDGNHVIEKVVDWEDGHSMHIEITDGSMPLRCAEATLRVEALGPDQTRVSMTMHYEPKFGPLGWMMDKLMMKRTFASMLGQVLEGLGVHARTGDIIGKDGKTERSSLRAA